MKPFKNILRAWLPFAVVISAFCGLTYAAVQQSFRQGANDPQVQMAEDAALSLANGADPSALVPPGTAQAAHSLTPFLIVYDPDGKILAASVELDGKTPGLPAGVLESTRGMGENRVTWQPRAGVRIAAVIVANDAGFVLAGRSLREAEARTGQLTRLTGAAWILSLAAALAAVAFGEFLLTDRKPG